MLARLKSPRNHNHVGTENEHGELPSGSAYILPSAGVLLVCLAVVYNELLLGLAVHITPERARAIRSAEGIFLGAGVLLWAAGECVLRLRPAILQREWVLNGLLAVMASLLPVLVLESALRPFAVFSGRQKTTIYMKDPELGWKHRSNASDDWGGARATINGKGLRGRELPYEKPPGITRILYLGDSVTFGDELPKDEQTFPYVADAVLRNSGRRVETINAGVSGYSPWQEHLYLVREGIRYQPDLVVVGFVLNDVTEKFELIRFGGTGEGWQLSNSYTSWFDALCERSAIANVANRVGQRLRFGQDIQGGARKAEAIDMASLIETPDRNEVKHAWNVTLAELDRIFDFCEENRLRLVVVIFPARFQYERNRDSVTLPQDIVARHARSRGKAVLDLWPAIAERAARNGTTPARYFIDTVHFTTEGNRVIGELIGQYVEETLFAGMPGG